MNRTGIALEPRYRGQLLDIIRRNVAGSKVTVFLFGSRARGNPRSSSDIDLAIKAGKDAGLLVSRLRADFEESTIPYMVDVVDCETCGPALAEEISREGTVLWTS